MDLEQQGINAANVVVALIANYGLRVIGAIAILIGGWIAARLVHTAIVRACLDSPRIDRTIAFFLASGARYAVLIFTVVAMLASFGIATTSIVAVLGATGLAIGLALQGTLSNLAAGLMIVLFRPFHVGDRIEAGDVTGTVREINLFYSEVDTDANIRVVVPNSMLWGQTVSIPSRNDTERLEFRFTRPLSDEIGIAIDRVKDIVGRDPRITNLAQIGVDAVTDANYVLVVRFWVARADVTNVLFDFNRTIKEEFQRHPPVAEQARAAD
ncbi:MAG: mechanosensitive ion channel [Proteobacteria bacterium]|nr:mechanosensitive ion channel [Pseudomonadota bacterium]